MFAGVLTKMAMKFLDLGRLGNLIVRSKVRKNTKLNKKTNREKLRCFIG